MAALRLGDSLFYASKQRKGEEGDKGGEKEVRRYFFMRREKDPVFGKNYYACYAFTTENGVNMDPKCEQSYRAISKEFKKELKLLNDRLKNQNSVVLITDLKNMEKDDKKSDPPSSHIYSMRLRRK